MADSNQPDWHSIAEKFDMWLPQIEPVGEAMLVALQAQAGDKVLDVASGTGEPALTLAQRMGDVEVTGTDAAEGMVQVAQGKVDKLALKNVCFKTMPGESLDFADASFDKLICRFGIMFFKDTAKGLREMYRVLKPGGRFCFAVWNTPETMPLMNWSYQAFQGKIPIASLPALDVITSLGAPGLFDNLMKQAGLQVESIIPKKLNYTFDSFDHFWQISEASDILKAQFDALPANLKDTVRDEIADFARNYISEKGMHVPHEYLLASGTK